MLIVIVETAFSIASTLASYLLKVAEQLEFSCLFDILECDNLIHCRLSNCFATSNPRYGSNNDVEERLLKKKLTAKAP